MSILVPAQLDIASVTPNPKAATGVGNSSGARSTGSNGRANRGEVLKGESSTAADSTNDLDSSEELTPATERWVKLFTSLVETKDETESTPVEEAATDASTNKTGRGTGKERLRPSKAGGGTEGEANRLATLMAAGQVKSPAVPSTDSAVPEVRKSKPAKDIESGEEKGSPAESTQICTTDELLTPAVMVPTEAQTKFTASIREDDGGARIGTPTHTRSVAEDGQAAGVAGEAVESNEGLAESEPTGPGLVAGLTGHLDKEAGLQPGPTGLSISIPGANGVSPAEPNRSAQAKHSFAQTQTSDGSMAIIGSRSARSRVAMGESASSLQIPDTVEKLTSEDGSLGEAEEAGESIEPNWDISLELKERKVAVKPKIVEATKDLEAKAIPDPTKESESSPGETRGQEKATKQAPSGQPHEEARLSPATALETIRQDVRDPNGESGASPALQAKKPEEAPKAEPTRGIHQAMETEQTLKGREPRIVSIRIPLVDGDAATRHIDLVFRNRGDALSLRVGVESDSVQQKLTAELPTLLKKLETVDWHLNSPGVTEGVGQTREMLATDSHGRTEFGRSIAENNVPASGQSTSPDEQFNPNQPGNGQSRNQQGQDRRRGGNRINNWRNALAEETTE